MVAFEVWKLFFDADLILDIQTTLRLQKLIAKTFDGNTLKIKPASRKKVTKNKKQRF